MKKPNKVQQIIDRLKRAKKAARDEEIANYGKPICRACVVKSKKVYTRKIKHKNKEQE